jgi:hypothetical protein
MKNSILLLVAVFILSLNVKAQVKSSPDQIATFEDGTKISYKVLENAGDDQFRNTIAGFNLADNRSLGNYSLMYARFEPKKFYAHAELGFGIGTGFSGIMIGGTYFLGANYKEYMLPMSIRTESNGSTSTKYVIKTPSVKNRHFGVDAQIGYKKYDVSLEQISANNHNYTLTSLSNMEIAVGLGYLTTKHAVVKVDGEKFIGGNKLFHLTADVLFFPGTKFEYTANDSVSATVALKADDFMGGAVGFRLQAQGQTSFKFTKKEYPGSSFGFFWRAGIMKASYISTSGIPLTNGIGGVFALGIFCNFG